MDKISITICALALFAFQLSAQINVYVHDADGPIPFAGVSIIGASSAGATNESGIISFPPLKPGTYSIQVSSLGYKGALKEIRVENAPLELDIRLYTLVKNLDVAVVTGAQQSTMLSKSPVKIEVATAKFLQANPSPSIIESLHYLNGVQEVINCGVCGTNDIHLNGLEGPYTLMLIDGMPIMSALASVYGFNGIPNSMISQVEIIKGPSSTLYGTEAVGGVINIITKTPDQAALFAFNSFVTSHGESNTDLSFSKSISKNASSTLGINLFQNQKKIDDNQDDFTDIPLSKRISIFNKWGIKHQKNNESQWSIRYYAEERSGGELDWKVNQAGSHINYGEYIKTNRFELIGSSELRNKENFQIQYSYSHHLQDSYYGTTHFKAQQQVAYAAFNWRKTLGYHQIVTGINLRLTNYLDNSPVQTEALTFIPGMFVQDHLTLSNKIQLLFGARLDHHKAHGMIFSPRINLKYSPDEYSSLRLNAGTGFRVVNLFTEDHAALSGSRQVVISEDLKPESSLNINLNYNRMINLKKQAYATLDADIFWTYFNNKIVPNYDINPDYIYYFNLTGHAISKGVSLNLKYYPSPVISTTIGSTFLRVYEVQKFKEDQIIKPQLFSPIWSVSVGADFLEKKTGIKLDYTSKIMGPMNLPQYEAPFERAPTSPIVSLHHLKFSKTLPKKIEVYFAIKNIFNYTQESPLIDSQNPFGPNFDTNYAYGPLQGRRFLFGIQFEISAKNQP